MQEKTDTDLIRFAKSRAKKLREYLKGQGHLITHSESLEATAQAEGFRDWNTYRAQFALVESNFGRDTFEQSCERPQFPMQLGERVRGTYRGSPFKGLLIGLEETITPGVWRAKLHFDEPVNIAGGESVGHTRQRVRLMLNDAGLSVNLKGCPDGFAAVEMP